jgi:hypothetical protein
MRQKGRHRRRDSEGKADFNLFSKSNLVMQFWTGSGILRTKYLVHFVLVFLPLYCGFILLYQKKATFLNRSMWVLKIQKFLRISDLKEYFRKMRLKKDIPPKKKHFSNKNSKSL